jgi:predicted dehydrogenase
MAQSTEPICLAIVGLGNWGRNHVRTFASLAECRVKHLFDANRQTLDAMLRAYSHLRGAESLEEIWNDPQVQAVVIATTAASHFELAHDALRAGKDVLVEKPMTLRAEDAEELCRIAADNGRILQVGHLLLFHPAVRYLKGLIDGGDLGQVHYIYSQRLNLGVVRSDENSLWSLAPHDISLINYLVGAAPVQVKATGGCYLQKAIEDVIFLNLTYPDGRIAHVHVSWLDPHKVRRLTIVGSRKMAVFDDMATTEKVRIYDKGVSRLDYENFGELLSVRTGDILIPSIPNTEPLKLQAQHFIQSVRERLPPAQAPANDGYHGLEVVRTLEQSAGQLQSA